MTHFLNVITHIGNYAGVGMVMTATGIILIVAAVAMISRQRKIDRRRTAAEFNQQFVRDTGARISDIEAGAKRHEIARELGITDNRPAVPDRY